MNNNGYTIERLIHGKTASYNTLPSWDYDALRSVFGPQHPSKYHGPIKTREQFENLLADEQFQSCKAFQVRVVTRLVQGTPADAAFSLWSSCLVSSTLQCQFVGPRKQWRRSIRRMRVVSQWVGREIAWFYRLYSTLSKRAEACRSEWSQPACMVEVEAFKPRQASGGGIKLFFSRRMDLSTSTSISAAALRQDCRNCQRRRLKCGVLSASTHASIVSSPDEINRLQLSFVPPMFTRRAAVPTTRAPRWTAGLEDDRCVFVYRDGSIEQRGRGCYHPGG